MPFTDPVKADSPLDTVRKIARLANLLLELRNDYERRPNQDILQQIRARSAELNELASNLPEGAAPPPPPPQV